MAHVHSILLFLLSVFFFVASVFSYELSYEKYKNTLIELYFIVDMENSTYFVFVDEQKVIKNYLCINCTHIFVLLEVARVNSFQIALK